METQGLSVEISQKISKFAKVLFFCWIGGFLLFTILGFTLFNERGNYSYLSGEITTLYWFALCYGHHISEHYIYYDSDFVSVSARTDIEGGVLCLVIFLNLFFLVILPLIYFLMNKRKRKLTELIVNKQEIVGSYTGFIPISKITLKMPIEKIDNIAAVNHFFSFYTGRVLRITSATSVIRIPFVENAGDVLRYISDAIEKAKNSIQSSREHEKQPIAEISQKISEGAKILFACWIGFSVLFMILGFTLFNQKTVFSVFQPYSGATYTEFYWFGMYYGFHRSSVSPSGVELVPAETDIKGGVLCLIIFLNLILLVVPPLIYFLIGRRKRKLSALTANEKEIVGSYTAFIPISKITLKMPIEKIDNIAAINHFFSLYTGRVLRIASTSSVIRIPYVANADEIVAFISEANEKAKNSSSRFSREPEKPQGDVADSLKKFAELRDSGIITEEEFQQKKSELLGKM